MSGLVGNPFLLTSAGAAGYQISRSLRFNSSDSAYLSRTPASAGNRKTWTWAGWVKRGSLSGTQWLFECSTSATYYTIFALNSDAVYFYDQSNGAVTSTALYRDPGAWMHLVLAVDTTQATASNRVKMYVNGAQITALSGTAYPTQNADTGVNSATLHSIGARFDGSYSLGFNGYLADIHFIDGQALTPSSFAETNATTGQWVPKAYTGSYGTNGFRLDFSDNSAATATTLGKDAAGSNNWTPNNFSVLTGSAVPIASATGGQPIHNTTDTFGATIGTGVRADANASTLVLAAPLTTAGSNNLSDDESPTGRTSSIKTLTANGSITSSTSVSRYYGGAALFASGGYYALSGSDFTFGTGDFTIEAWVYNPSTTEGSLFATHPNAFATTNFNSRFYGSLQRIDIYTSGAGDYMSITGIPVDQWIHIAMCRSGGTTMRLFVNGTLRGTSNGWGMSLSDSQFFINGGRDGSGARYYQDVRVYKGLAKYSSNFVVPNAAPNPTLGAGNDSLVDTPTSYGTDTGAGGEVRGNYATLNPLQSSATLSNGNLDCSTTSTSWQANVGTVFQSSGKWYAEFTVSSIGAGGIHIGIVGPNYLVAAGNYIGNTATSYAYRADGTKFNNATQTSYGASYTTNDVIGVAMDLDAGTLVFYKNGVSQGTAYSGMTGAKAFAVSVGSTTGIHSVVFNAGQRPFAYAAPSGFKALCDTNLPAPVIAKSSTVMDVKLYTGNGSTQTISGLGFSPDLVWIKSRSNSSENVLVDAIRGSTNVLSSNAIAAEYTISDGVTSLNAGGFSLGADSFYAYVNGSSRTYAAWCWDAGTSTVTNTQGSITSQVRANASAGFSIVTYTGNVTYSTIGHGLGIRPSLIIVKSRTGATNWAIYHSSLGASAYLYFNTAAVATDNVMWQGVSPTSSVFSVGNYNENNGSNTYVAYCFAPVAGYSAFGSYTGNGSADGPFVYTGFKPRWVMIKRSDSASVSYGWFILDTARNTYNVMNTWLAADSSAADGADVICDTLANGFKIRTTAGNINTNAGTFVYACFAESPLQYARAR